MFLKCVCVFENSKDCLKIDQVTRSLSTYSKSLSCTFLTLWHCCFTIVFGKQPYIWMLNGTGVGHRMTMIAMVLSILASFLFEGLDHLCIGNQDSVIEGLWSFVFVFVLPRYLACIPWPFLRKQVDETLGMLVCIVLSFFMHFCLVFSHTICLILVFAYKTLIYYHGIWKR